LWITTNCGEFWKRWEYQTIEWTGSKLGKEYVKAVYCHRAYLTYMQSISCKMPSWSTSWNQDCWEKYNINHLRYANDTTQMAESEEELKRMRRLDGITDSMDMSLSKL